MKAIREPERETAITHETDLVVVGGSCTGIFAAVRAARVMVNMNQTGEAAGVACALASQNKLAIWDLDPQRLRSTLAKGGSIML